MKMGKRFEQGVNLLINQSCFSTYEDDKLT